MRKQPAHVNIDDWTTQLKKGTLEYCILLLIRENPCYGYEIMSRLSKWPLIAVKESTVYPLLRRLQKDGCLDSYWQESAEGIPPRKYYSITQEGRHYLEMMSSEWDSLTDVLAHLRKESRSPA